MEIDHCNKFLIDYIDSQLNNIGLQSQVHVAEHRCYGHEDKEGCELMMKVIRDRDVSSVRCAEDKQRYLNNCIFKKKHTDSEDKKKSKMFGNKDR